MPGWGPGVDGRIGVKGLTTNVDAGLDDILPTIDMIGAGTLEIRRNRLGLIVDGLYIKASADGDTPGPLLSNVDVGFKQVLAEGALAYRLFENERAWVDLLVGARYVYLKNSLGLTVDQSGVTAISQELSSRVVDRTVEAVRTEVNSRLPTLIADFRERLVTEVQDRVATRVDGVRETIRDRIEEGIGSRFPLLPIGDGRLGTGVGDRISSSAPVRNAIKDYAKAAAEARIEEARATISPAVAAARANIRGRAEARLAEAEANLAETLEREITEKIPTSDISGDRGWVDPFIGFRARAELWDRWYAAFRGDVGGFGVNSELTLNLFGALGYQMRDNMTVELGYRHLSIDYQSGGFVYDTDMSGPYLGLGLTF